MEKQDMINATENETIGTCAGCGREFPTTELSFNHDTEQCVKDTALRRCGREVPKREYPDLDTDELLCKECYEKKYSKS